MTDETNASLCALELHRCVVNGDASCAGIPVDAVWGAFAKVVYAPRSSRYAIASLPCRTLFRAREREARVRKAPRRVRRGRGGETAEREREARLREKAEGRRSPEITRDGAADTS